MCPIRPIYDTGLELNCVCQKQDVKNTMCVIICKQMLTAASATGLLSISRRSWHISNGTSAKKKWPPSVTIRVKIYLFQTSFIFILHIADNDTRHYKYPDSHFLYAIFCTCPMHFFDVSRNCIVVVTICSGTGAANLIPFQPIDSRTVTVHPKEKKKK